MKTYVTKLMQLEHLTRAEAYGLCEELFATTNAAQIAAALVLLHAKGEIADELLGFIDFIQAQMIPIHYPGDVLDIVGTGGDGADTVNISTAAALLAARCGARVIKHGSRSRSSRCGSADLIEKMGLPLHSTPEQLIENVQATGFGFCLTSDYHVIMKKLASIRRDLAVPTVFNVLGALLNPARVPYMLCGVYTKKLLPIFADVLLHQNIKHAFVVYGNGLDELNCLGKNDAIEIVNGKKYDRVIDPKDYGFEYCTLKDLQGGSADANAKIIANVLSGRLPGPLANTIALNAGVALYMASIADSIEAGVALALENLASSSKYSLGDLS